MRFSKHKKNPEGGAIPLPHSFTLSRCNYVITVTTVTDTTFVIFVTVVTNDTFVIVVLFRRPLLW